jgi:hypothetical protein
MVYNMVLSFLFFQICQPLRLSPLGHCRLRNASNLLESHFRTASSGGPVFVSMHCDEASHSCYATALARSHPHPALPHHHPTPGQSACQVSIAHKLVKSAPVLRQNCMYVKAIDYLAGSFHTPAHDRSTSMARNCDLGQPSEIDGTWLWRTWLCDNSWECSNGGRESRDLDRKTECFGSCFLASGLSGERSCI